MKLYLSKAPAPVQGLQCTGSFQISVYATIRATPVLATLPHVRTSVATPVVTVARLPHVRTSVATPVEILETLQPDVGILECQLVARYDS